MVKVNMECAVNKQLMHDKNDSKALLYKNHTSVISAKHVVQATKPCTYEFKIQAPSNWGVRDWPGLEPLSRRT